MCNNVKSISKTSQGELSLCKNCKHFHLEFNNIYFEFTVNEFKQFKQYILNLEADFWECKYASAGITKKIPIPTLQDNLVLMFNRQEVNQLKTLVKQPVINVYDKLITVDDVDYTLILN